MKYRLLENDTIKVDGRTLHRIECLTPFGNVKAGDKGGYIESEKNLSQKGNAWVCDNAKVSGNAEVYGNVKVSGDVWVCGNAEIGGNAEVKSSRDYMVFKNYWSSGRYFTYTRSDRMWMVGCFHGTGEELIRKAYNDSEDSGRHYEAFVRFAERLEEMDVEKNDIG